MNSTNQKFIFAGVIVHYISLVINICMTSAAMLGWPSKSAYDSWWTTSGFCVVQDASIPTELLCYLSLTASAIIAYALTKNNKQLKQDNPLLLERIQTSVFANAAHGFGHAFLWFMGEAAPPLEISLRPAAIANILMLVAFWVGSLKNVVGLPTDLAAGMSIVVLAAQYALHVPPELAFTYSQSVILLGGTFEQLRRRDEYSKKDGFLFFAVSLYYLPLFVLYFSEMFLCSKGVLAELGGHAVYDLYLALVPFGFYYAVTMFGRGDKTSNISKKVD
mmetsp:Transcript_1541/g.2819  ORF Transcript_1541/g.2819 Transcript_1541/m.2819 type:complete len:276 (+) Transcript_1541:291-1118(+)